MADPRSVEKTTKYVTTVDQLSEAWAFVMEHIEHVGPHPEIEISPIEVMPVGSDVWSSRFSVRVEGMVEEHA